MIKVVKRYGATEEFVPEKIIVSAIKAGASPSVAREIAKTVEARVHDGVSTEEIRKIVSELLREKNPDWEKSFQFYDLVVKKRRRTESR